MQKQYNDSTAKEGWIQVLTIKDAEGNDIVIADANGNAAIEVEEAMGGMLLNQLYGNIDNLGDFEPSAAVSESKGQTMLTTGSLEYNSMSWQEKFYRGFLENEEIEKYLGIDMDNTSEDELQELMRKAYEDVTTKKEAEKAENQKDENALTQSQWDTKQEELIEEFKAEYVKLFTDNNTIDELDSKQLDDMAIAAKEYADKIMEDKGYKLK